MTFGHNVLCVAEKNDAAKNIAQILSGGHSIRREGRSRFNKLYCFSGEVRGERSNIVFTSVSGHITEFQFGNEYAFWDQHTIEALFSATVYRAVPPEMSDIEMTLR